MEDTQSSQKPETKAGVSEITDLSFLKVYASGNPELMKKFIRLFLERIPVTVQELEDQFAARDFINLSRTAHSLKPQLSYMGIKAAQDNIVAIEELAKDETHPESIPYRIENLKTLLNTAYKELDGQLNIM